MSLGKQSKVLTDKQIETMLAYVSSRRNGIRNRAILHLSVKAGLRAKEIACLKWAMVLNAGGETGASVACALIRKTKKPRTLNPRFSERRS